MAGNEAQYGAGQGNFKPAVVAATTAAIADLTAASVTQDGVTLVQGDRLLVKDQASQTANGIYTVGTVATGTAPLTRAVDAATTAQCKDMVVPVSLGTVNKNKVFKNRGVSSFTLGSSNIVFEELGGVQRAIVTVSSAELLALNATPKTLVAAPGAGLFIEPINLHAWLDYNSAAYAGIGAGEDLTFKWTNGSGGEMLTAIEATGFLDATADAHRICYPSNPAANVVPVANAAIVLHMSSGEVTTGDSPLKVEVLYRIRALEF